MKYIIFCDGASSGNPGKGGWASIVFDGEKVNEIGGNSQLATNNQMELTSAIKGLSMTEENSSVEIFTDSSYVLDGITKWIYGWQKNRFRNKKGEKIKNEKFWEKLSELTSVRKVKWFLVKGHSGVAGNERCDEIATSYSQGKRPNLFKGGAEKYLFSFDEKVKVSPIKKRSNPKSISKSGNKKEFVYLSLVKGILVRHSDWSDCEKRVKGASGAKFKKVSSPEEEKIVLKGWGL